RAGQRKGQGEGRGRRPEEEGMRPGLLGLGIGLGILWLAGLSAHAAPWLVWINFVIAVLSILTAAAPATGPSLVKVTPFLYGVALLLLWIIGLGVRASYWMVWWTFAFGIVYLIYGVAASRPEQHIGRPAGGQIP